LLVGNSSLSKTSATTTTTARYIIPLSLDPECLETGAAEIKNALSSIRSLCDDVQTNALKEPPTYI
jgi:hypothetical protein